MSCLAIGSWLLITNPREKKPYLDHAARQLQTHCCLSTSASAFDSCQLLRPITQPLVRSVLRIYTDPPSDYRLFTMYTTRLPIMQTVRGVGVAGRIFIWNYPAADGQNPCATLYDSSSTQPVQQSAITLLPPVAPSTLVFQEDT